MKRSDTMVLAAVGVVALIAGFWFLVLAPKRSQVSDLDSQANTLQGQIDQQRQVVSSALAARSSFAADYQKLVVLGKAVPADSEQASLLVELNTLADKSGVQFQSLDLTQNSSAIPAPAAPATTTTGTTATSSDTTSTSTSTTDTTSSTSTDASTDAQGTNLSTSTPPAPTEGTAASLPLGAAIGPAGLPVMPYDLTFTGGYFQIANFLHRLDSLVHTRGGELRVSGRLLTVNSFDLSPANSSGGTTTPTASLTGLRASLSVTTYLSPSSGTTAGASPTGPAPVTPSTAVPASTTTSTAPSTSPTTTTTTTPASTDVSSTPTP